MTEPSDRHGPGLSGPPIAAPPLGVPAHDRPVLAGNRRPDRPHGPSRAQARRGVRPQYLLLRKVFIPLTKLCRDVCHYCTFAERPSQTHAAYLSADEVLAIARAGQEAGCTEALFTLGDKTRTALPRRPRGPAELGHATTISYLREMCALVLKENYAPPPREPRNHDPRGNRVPEASLRQPRHHAGIHQ